MGLFDWIPTAEEILDFTACRLTGHDWKQFVRDGHVYRICETCQKVERVT